MVKIVKFDPKLPTLEVDASRHPKSKMPLIDRLNLAVKLGRPYQEGDAELLAGLEAAGIKRDPQLTATARNNLFLRGTKLVFNQNAYRAALWLVHCYGEEAAKLYLSQFTDAEDVE
jgi:hypothetical protein